MTKTVCILIRSGSFGPPKGSLAECKTLTIILWYFEGKSANVRLMNGVEGFISRPPILLTVLRLIDTDPV